MEIKVELFTPLLQSAVTLRDSAGTELQARLLEAQSRGAATDAAARAPFTLLFEVIAEGAAVEAVQQGVYQLSAQELEPFDIFLVPVQPSGEGQLLEAVFN